MTCNLSGGRIYKGSIAEITVPMFPRCYTGSTDELVVDFYTTRGGTSIEYSVSAGTIELDGVNGTVVFQVPQLGVLDDGNLRYTTRCGDDYLVEWQSRWFIVTPQDFTPVEYITSENVQEVVEGLMDEYTTTEEVENIVTAATTGFTTQAQVGAMITSATINFVTSAQVETTLNDYAKLTDIPDVSVYATKSELSQATDGVVKSAENSTIPITNIWVGTEAQYYQIPTKDNYTLYIII